ncbi:MAG: nuclear transport factor 2 family protein [Actinomycetota bacterium]|nr:nuclear transport factor 2 family protein [Actinomycetota bacterium]
MISGRPRQGEPPIAGELAEDATTVRAAYQALEEGDEEALTYYLDPQVEWVHPAVTRLPFDGTLRGLPSVLRAAFRRDEEGNGLRVSAETFLEIGDGVLVAGRFLEDGEDDGVPFLHECSVRGGRIALIREYPA